MQFNALLEKFADLGSRVIGVSANSHEKSQVFAQKHNLSLLLLSDTHHVALKECDGMETEINT
jgi:peroxiredoxin